MRLLVFGLGLWLLLSGVSEACQLYRDVMRDSSGNVIAGVTVTVTLAGTSTAATLYSDDRCSTTLSNPFLSSTNGEFSFYAKDGEYGLVFAKGPGYTFTNISRLAIYDPLGENIVTVAKYTTMDICQTGTGAIDQIGATQITLVVNKPVTCSASKTMPATVKLQFQGSGVVTIATGKILTITQPTGIISPSTQQIFAGAGTVSFTTSGIVYPRWWGVTGTADEVAINKAIAAVPSNSTILLEGLYTLANTVLLNKSRVHLVGIGAFATQLNFMPAADGTAVRVNGNGTELFQGSIRDLAITSDDRTYTKTAIDLVDTSGWSIQNVAINGTVLHGSSYYWSGGTGSIGLRTHGREFGLVRNLFSAADKPLVISDNPNSTIDIDHFNFQDTYFLAYKNPVVTIETGVNLTNVAFIGSQPWVLGTYGLYWVDTTSAGGNSQNLRLENIRWEQGSDPTAYLVRIEHHQALQGFQIVNSSGGADRKGVKLRKVENVLFDSLLYESTTLEALNIDSSVKRVECRNCFWQAGGTATVMGQRTILSSSTNPPLGPLPPNFLYDEHTNQYKGLITDAAISGSIFTVANNADVALGDDDTLGAIITITTNDYLSAIYELRGTQHSVAEIADAAGFYSPTAGTATSTNIYWDAGTSRYRLQNKRGSSMNYKIAIFGTLNSF
jgi:hypothetical protein